MKIKEERKCKICIQIFKTLSTSNRKTCSAKCSCMYKDIKQKEYQQRPENKAKRKKCRVRPEIKAKLRECQQRPEIKAIKKMYDRKRVQNLKGKMYNE